MLKSIIEVIKKYNLAANTVNNIKNIVDYKIRYNHLLNCALQSTNTLLNINTVDITTEPELIVSLTTYSKRIFDVAVVIESIGQQTKKPDRILLWLDQDEFTIDTIPYLLHKQIDRGLEIQFCKNIRSYKKLIPTLQENPKANIITIDDDVLYPIDTVELLYRESVQYPNTVICHRAHKIKYNENNEILPYKEWEIETAESKGSDDIFPVGIGGVFYPAYILSSDCTNDDIFMKLAPNADDIWFKAMTKLNGYKSKKVADSRSFNERFMVIDENQDMSLFKNNLHQNANDTQLKAVFNYYNI